MHAIKTLIALSLSLGSMAVLAQSASAPAATPGVDQRQARQEQRIEPGQASGALTPREARRLDHQQAHIAGAESHAKADGTVTRAERKRLHHMQDHASQNIRHQKHDRQHAAPKTAPSGN